MFGSLAAQEQRGITDSNATFTTAAMLKVQHRTSIYTSDDVQALAFGAILTQQWSRH